MDKALMRDRCDKCGLWFYLDQLVRLKLFDAQGNAEILNEVFCNRCLDVVKVWWSNADATVTRFYSSA